MTFLMDVLARPKPPIIKHLSPPEWAYAAPLRWVTVGMLALAVVINFAVWVSAHKDLRHRRIWAIQRGRDLKVDGPVLAARMLAGDELLRMAASLLLVAIYGLAVYLATPVPGLALAQTILGAILAMFMAGKSLRMAYFRGKAKTLPPAPMKDWFAQQDDAAAATLEARVLHEQRDEAIATELRAADVRERANAEETQAKLDVIHGLVNSQMTAALQSELDATIREVALMREVIDLKRASGHEPTQEALTTLEATEAKIEELTISLAERRKADAENVLPEP